MSYMSVLASMETLICIVNEGFNRKKKKNQIHNTVYTCTYKFKLKMNVDKRRF